MQSVTLPEIQAFNWRAPLLRSLSKFLFDNNVSILINFCINIGFKIGHTGSKVRGRGYVNYVHPSAQLILIYRPQ